jgi:hypothetical protein
MTNLLTGREFNKQYPSTVFVKLTNETEIHNGFQFKTGMNVDTEKFDPTSECKGGIYFCELRKFTKWLNYAATICVNYRVVSIPDDAKIYIEKDKFKANKIILSEKKEIMSHEKMRILAIRENTKNLFYINEYL